MAKVVRPFFQRIEIRVAQLRHVQPQFLAGNAQRFDGNQVNGQRHTASVRHGDRVRRYKRLTDERIESSGQIET